jgi:hypothetical protein
MRTFCKISINTGSDCRWTWVSSKLTCTQRSHAGLWKQKRTSFWSVSFVTGGSCRKSPQRINCSPPNGRSFPLTARATRSIFCMPHQTLRHLIQRTSENKKKTWEHINLNSYTFFRHTLSGEKNQCIQSNVGKSINRFWLNLVTKTYIFMGKFHFQPQLTNITSNFHDS